MRMILRKTPLKNYSNLNDNLFFLQMGVYPLTSESFLVLLRALLKEPLNSEVGWKMQMQGKKKKTKFKMPRVSPWSICQSIIFSIYTLMQ